MTAPTPAATVLGAWLAERTGNAKTDPLLGHAVAALLDQPDARAREVVLVEMLAVLDRLGVDNQTLAAAIYGDLSGDTASRPTALAALIDGQREAAKVWHLHQQKNHASAEGLRRLLLAIVQDLRVVLVLLARQLVALRHAGDLTDPERRNLAEYCADINAPLANRLGIWEIKWEMEDLCFRWLQPERYIRIVRLLDERRSDRERYIRLSMKQLQGALAKQGIAAEISGRPKHIFSIWKKLQRKQTDFDHLYDLRALRVVVDDLAACYAALGVVHQLWPNLPGEFDDYIARPKGNDYRSLHTAVIGPEGKTLEIQIRTHEMHAHAELGVAAHWRYKEGGSADQSFERKIAQMRRLLDARGDADNDTALLAGIRTELIDDRVYLLTPKGNIVDLARGGTVLDFAYHVHTEVGHRCRGAKVNGRIVPLSFCPSSGDTIEIITAKQSAPRRDWIIHNNPFVVTSRARDKVRAWFRAADHARNLAAGRELLERELKRTAQSGADLAPVLERLELKSADELMLALAVGDVSSTQVARLLHEAQTPAQPKATRSPRPARTPADGIAIHGVGNLLYNLARCCQPLPGDAIVGYLTRARGVSVHRADCRSLVNLMNREPARMVTVEWRNPSSAGFEVNIEVRALDRKGLLKDVSALIAAADADVIAASTDTRLSEGEAVLSFALKVSDFGQLSALLGKIQTLPNVLDARRVLGPAPR